MITTAKGVVLGRMNSEQRRVETEIAAFALRRLGITPVLTISGEGRLEGGDFLPAGDTAFIGQGLRTNAEAVRQLLAADAFGAARVVVVKDPWQNQEQMHLDTYFNIAGPDLAVLVEERMADPARRPVVDVLEKRGAAYEQVLAGGDFREYLETTLGFTVIPVSGADQLRYGINFLTVAPRRVLAIDGVSEALKERLRAHGIAATWMDFGNLTGGYGAAHCTTQVLRRVP
jgi:arginine deiminase